MDIEDSIQKIIQSQNLDELKAWAGRIQSRPARAGNPFALSKDTIARRHIAYLGPMADALAILIHVGDKEFYAPSRDGLTLDWMSIVDLFIEANPHITWSDVQAQLAMKGA